MKVFIDTDNALSLARSRSLGANQYDNCMRMLKYHCDLFFQFPKDIIKEVPELMDWIKIMADGNGFTGSVKWGQPIYPQPRPLKFNLHKQLNEISDLSSVYLINDINAEKISDSGFLAIAPVGREIQLLSNLILTEDGQYVFTFNPSSMRGWQAVKPYTSPLTDIILIDQYILSSPEIYEPNLYSLIEQISSVAHNTQLNIVIFTLPQYYDKQTKRTVTPNIASITRELKKRTKKTTGVEANITFVLSTNLREHDRTLFTNMKFYVSGDSFNYFDSANHIITNGRYLHIHSMGSKQNFELGMALIADMQKIIEELEGKNPDLITGKKECNFLTFS